MNSQNNNHENYGYIVADTPEKIRAFGPALSSNPIPWNKFKDVMPTREDFPCQFNDIREKRLRVFQDSTGCFYSKDWTHWRSLKSIIPTDLPPQEPSESEKACNQYYADYNKTINIENPPQRKEIWDASWLACEQWHKEKGEK